MSIQSLTHHLPEHMLIEAIRNPLDLYILQFVSLKNGENDRSAYESFFHKSGLFTGNSQSFKLSKYGEIKLQLNPPRVVQIMYHTKLSQTK